ncbi:MAG: TraB/GumN family protein [Thermoplasmata archaeon]
MITLLGVGHVFNLGPRIREEILKRRPALVCIELDPARLRALRDGRTRARAPTLYNLLALFQKRIAEQYGADVGEEMLAAYDAALEEHVPIALIDVDSLVTWKRLWSSMRPMEILKLVVSGIGSLFVGRSRIEAELNRYREDYAGFIRDLERDYPSVKRVLVDERNEYMASRLKELHRRSGNIVCVVGDGHIEGLGRLLETEDLEVVRLWDLRPGNLQ